MPIKSVQDLEVYGRAYRAAMAVFRLSRRFPKEERFSLTDQLVRASRSVAANIREGYAKRAYENVFRQHLLDALGSAEETLTWLDFARDCGYLDAAKHAQAAQEYNEICSMLYVLRKNWRKLTQSGV